MNCCKMSNLRLAVVLSFLFVSIPNVAQSKSKYEVATIMEVQLHRSEQNSSSDTISYDVSLKVGDTLYVVLYTPPLGENTVKYVAGRDALVLVGKKTITYNDILGNSREVPILSQRPAAVAKASK